MDDSSSGNAWFIKIKQTKQGGRMGYAENINTLLLKNREYEKDG